MAWYDSSTPIKVSGTQVMETVSLSPQRLSDLADYFGVQITQDKDGHYLAVPQNLDLNDPKYQTGFMNFWLEESSYSFETEHDRVKRIQTYKQMDVAMAEASISLDTYADESLGIGFVDDPIEIKISDKTVSKLILDLLEKNEITKRLRSIIRNMCKYGDIGYKINLPLAYPDKSFEDIELEYIDPLSWEVALAKDSTTVIGYRVGSFHDRQKRAPVSHGGSRGPMLNPWEFIHMSVFDEDYKPYGKSLLEPMRVDFDHLMTMEALLAMSRAARVERLVIKVPTGSNNPIQAAQKIQAVKTQFKNTIFKDTSLGAKTYARTPIITDVLVMPSDANFSIEKLPTGVDLSSIEDVQYFRDKAFVSTGLPKTYFLHDQAQARGSALQQEDIMFARKLVQYQNALVEGITKMIMVLAVYVTKADISTLKVQVKLKKPPQLSLSLVEYYQKLVDTASSMCKTWMDLSGASGDTKTAPDGTTTTSASKVPPEMFQSLLTSLGMPESISKVFTTDPITPPDTQMYITSAQSIVRTQDDVHKLDPYFGHTLKLLAESLQKKAA